MLISFFSSFFCLVHHDLLAEPSCFLDLLSAPAGSAAGLGGRLGVVGLKRCGDGGFSMWGGRVVWIMRWAADLGKMMPACLLWATSWWSRNCRRFIVRCYMVAEGGCAME